MADALRAHAGEIADEVLATQITESTGAAAFTDKELGLTFSITVA